MFNPPYPSKLVNKGTCYNYGAEFTLERFLNKNFFFFLQQVYINQNIKEVMV